MGQETAGCSPNKNEGWMGMKNWWDRMDGKGADRCVEECDGTGMKKFGPPKRCTKLSKLDGNWGVATGCMTDVGRVTGNGGKRGAEGEPSMGVRGPRGHRQTREGTRVSAFAREVPHIPA